LPADLHEHDDFPLDPVVIEALWAMEDRHFWHAARNAWIVEALRRAGAGERVLEIGCGSGAVACSLQGNGYKVVGVDTAEPLVRKAQMRCPTATFVVSRVEDLPSALRGPYDVLGLFDVLEHLEHPAALLRSSLPLLRPGGLVVATVPAQRRLHSVVDDLVGHRRRYEVGELAALFAQVGLRDVRERGLFRFMAPIMRLRRAKYARSERREILLADLAIPAAPVNLAMRLACGVERLLFDRALGKAGASLLAVGTFTARPA